MRISDWSSDVCSSDLISGVDRERAAGAVLDFEADFLEQLFEHRLEPAGADILDLRIHLGRDPRDRLDAVLGEINGNAFGADQRSEEHTSELQSLMRISYAVFCLKKKKHLYINLH